MVEQHQLHIARTPPDVSWDNEDETIAEAIRQSMEDIRFLDNTRVECCI